jgi:L-2,4-diaminobutyrate decarboxylase
MPEANIVCFRYGTSDDLQLALREALIREGYYLSSAEVGEVRWLRIVVMSPTTDDATIEGLLGAIERLAPGLD